MVVSPLGMKSDLGNTLALQVRGPRVERRTGVEWVRWAFAELCGELSPVRGAACHPAEYWAKVMSDGPEIRADGRDFGRHLPGLFWLNFFGRPHRDLLGAERSLSAPGEEVARVDDGVLVALEADPTRWDEPDHVATEQRVRDHLGPELFYAKSVRVEPASFLTGSDATDRTRSRRGVTSAGGGEVV